MGSATPKQYLELGGLSLLRRSIESWNSHSDLLVQVVISADAQELYQQATADTLVKLLPVVFGGHDRQSSVHNGLKALEIHQPTHVLIHDAARPCMPTNVYDEVLDAAIECGGGLPALPQVDSLHEVEDGFVKQPVDRSRFARAQTPQGFAFKPVFDAHSKFADQGFTDDVSLAIAAGMKVKLVDGHEDGMKITAPSDLAILAKQKGLKI